MTRNNVVWTTSDRRSNPNARFVPKFVNGVWAVLDRATFRHVGVFDTFKQADRAAARGRG